jgi:Fe2+ transport system protein FeoA
MIPLNFVSPNEDVFLKEVRGGGQFKRRITDLGLISGTLVHVVYAATVGPIIIEVKGTRLAIGQGMARRIFVEPISSSS